MTLPIDEGVGLIREKLVKLGLDRKTLVMFFSDNGAEGNIIGTAADSFTDPDLAVPGSGSEGAGIVIHGADSAIIRRNLIGFAGRAGISVNDAADDASVSENELRRNGGTLV